MWCSSAPRRIGLVVNSLQVESTAVAPTVMLAGRLIVKAGLLVIAIFVPADLAFTGTVVGALTFDITLVVVGSIIAASRTMRHTKEGR